uniref:Uncharacterized protein n=1 Tax=Arundo donax TaxID=35708 RepID=A0A0A9FWQ7_ARUDO
MSQPTTKAYTY